MIGQDSRRIERAVTVTAVMHGLDPCIQRRMRGFDRRALGTWPQAQGSHIARTNVEGSPVAPPSVNEKENSMSEHTYRVVEVVGSSPTSSDDAIRNAIVDAAKTIRNIRWYQVIETRGHVEADKPLRITKSRWKSALRWTTDESGPLAA
jgi:flavin-binding protein dodecin